jgi:MoaA/NifB/PqqE/SkfB family radical SAM enzyme
MQLSGIHILLTYRCTLECDHCFVWGSPWQEGTMTLDEVRKTLQQAKDAGTVEWIYFEGGEPFLFYALLRQGVEEAAQMGFKVGIVSNGYWATSVDDALLWLKPLAGLLQDLSISSDLFHWSAEFSKLAENASAAAKKLNIPVGTISIAQPEDTNATATTGQIPTGGSAVMYRGRAVKKLAAKANKHPWEQFDKCPYEDFLNPGRAHLDPLGNLHICQGISAGNIFETSLNDVCQNYDVEGNPIIEPLLEGGPAELVRRYNLAHEEEYADACHLCCDARQMLRERFPEILTPDQVYSPV